MEKQSYGFATAISMVIGVVIGSGIFFKADDILSAVNGSITLGLLGFLLVGIGVLFGALSISYYALKDSEHIGIIGYARSAFGHRFAFIVGWFSLVGYFPGFIVVLATVGSIYLSILLEIDSMVFITISTLILLICSFYINYNHPSFGGKLQVLFTVAKIIPLIVIGVIGSLFFQSDTQSIVEGSNIISTSNPLTAGIAIAFAFDGWIVATNISSELKNSDRNLPRALALGTIIIIVVYCIYFFGVSTIVGPEQIISLGDGYTEVAASAVLGSFGSKIITTFVIISIYGSLNGMTLAYLRVPRVLIDAKLMKNIYGENPKTTSFNMFIACSGITAFYYLFQQLLNYNLIFTNLEASFDLSNFPIIINYMLYIVLFILVNKMVKDEGPLKRVYYLIISLIATITALVIIYGTLTVNGLLYIAFSIILAVIGLSMFIVKPDSQV